VRHFPTHFRKMAKCMIYIGSYACGKCVGKCLTVPHCLTASPRRPRPLGGSVINGTIQQLLDTPQAPTGTHSARTAPAQRHTAPHSAPTWFHRPDIHEDVARHPQRPHSAPTWFHPRGCGKAPPAPAQRPHSATQRPDVVSSTKMRQAPHSARTAPHSARTAPHSATQRPHSARTAPHSARTAPAQRHTAPAQRPDVVSSTKMRQAPHSGLSGPVRVYFPNGKS
jgi:hypothetical protein